MVEGSKDSDDILACYEGLRKESLSWGTAAPARDGAARLVPPALARFSIGTNDFPEEAISSSGVSFLLSTMAKVNGVLSSPLPEAKDWLTAGIEMTRRYMLGLANVYLVWTAFLLACDRRFNPNAPVACDATRSFDVDAFGLPQRLDCLTKAAAFLHPILKEDFPGATFAGELRILQLAAAAYFDVMETVFALPSVGKCRIGFDRLMQAYGTPDAVGLVSNCLRRHRTMQRDIVRAAEADSGTAGRDLAETAFRELKSRSEAIEAKIDDIKVGVERNAKAVGKMDRRLKDAMKGLRTGFLGFVGLFRPGRPAPTREKVSAALLPAERYACLSRIKEPHRSQVKSVIDYTWNGHPVSFGDKSRSVYTLSDAVGDVWRANEAKWAKVPGTFAAERDLRAACYNIAEKADGGVSFNFK